jgi:hypothetical protein
MKAAATDGRLAPAGCCSAVGAGGSQPSSGLSDLGQASINDVEAEAELHFRD